MDPNQLPAGLFTPERPSGNGGVDNTAALLSSPFLLFANALSPITPSRALLMQGISETQAAALTALPKDSPAPTSFASPVGTRSGAVTGRHRRGSSLGKPTVPAGLEEVAMHADQAVLAAVNALAQSPLRPGVLDDVTDVAQLRKQLETQFDVNLTEPEAADAGMARALEEELRQLDGELELEQHARGLVGSSRSDDGARGGNGRRSLRGAGGRGIHEAVQHHRSVHGVAARPRQDDQKRRPRFTQGPILPR